MKNLVVGSLAIAFMLLTSFSLSAQNYVVDSEASSLAWTGNKLTGSHAGVVTIQNGSLTQGEKGMTGKFTIDMTSIKCTDMEGEYAKKLEDHLANEDFFNVPEHPVAAMTVTSVTKMEEPTEKHNYVVQGDLTIKGITHRIFFPAMIDMTEGLKATASFTIDRTKWDIQYGSGSIFDGLGDRIIYDDIEFDLVLVAK